MIYSDNLFEVLSSMIGQKRQTKSNSHFSQKTPYGVNNNFDQIVPNLWNFISHDLFYQYL